MLELDNKPSARLRLHGAEKVFLLPGQWYFGHTGAVVRTLLGSCIAIILWNPRRRMGGMCHFLLPTRLRTPDGVLDGRFGDEAMELMAHEIKKTGTKPTDYEAHIYGGADTMPDEAKVKFNVGERNVQKAWDLIDQYGFQMQTVDVGGTDPRNVTIDLHSGQIVLKRGQPTRGQKGPRP